MEVDGAAGVHLLDDVLVAEAPHTQDGAVGNVAAVEDDVVAVATAAAGDDVDAVGHAATVGERVAVEHAATAVAERNAVAADGVREPAGPRAAGPVAGAWPRLVAVVATFVVAAAT